ncbi:MAG: radical SAM family heme chaperone HemW [Paludibacteraceae bacterium]|nr:radical SAM family heme chaperone HemW [Paludibacteraceae bacterium]
MASIYIHIPFCKSRCIYCDFFSTTSLTLRNNYTQAICNELYLQQHFFQPNTTIQTIYLGGGTPSLLSIKQLHTILHTIRSLFTIAPNPEITIEANPQDLNPHFLQQLLQIGFNRLSIGIQSFDNQQLNLLKRRHNAKQAINAVLYAQQAGFNNISIDLIYAIPTQTINSWQLQLQQAIDLNIQHISTYCLTPEPNTPYYNAIQNHTLTSADDNTANQMLHLAHHILTKAHFKHYEVSNFALIKTNQHSTPTTQESTPQNSTPNPSTPQDFTTKTSTPQDFNPQNPTPQDFRSLHNSAYWNQSPYLGIGPAAHSYNGSNLRSANQPNLKLYINTLLNIPHTTTNDPHATTSTIPPTPPSPLTTLQILDPLTPEQIYNETIMLQLRTEQGINLNLLSPTDRTFLLQQAQPYLNPTQPSNTSKASKESNPSTPTTPLLTISDNHLRLASLHALDILDTITLSLIK